MTPTLLPDRPVQLRGSRIADALLHLRGWRVHFDGLPSMQGVLIVYPHTSNWDFVLGLLAKWSIGIDVTFWAKDSLFRVPGFAAWMRWLGGIPIDRKSSKGIVGQMVNGLSLARDARRFSWLALAPEGTRGRANGFRSGFYHVATQADVPLGLVSFDYGSKQVRVGPFMQLSGDANADMAAIAEALGRPRGARPELAAPIRLAP